MNKNIITSSLSLLSNAVKKSCNVTSSDELLYPQPLNDNLVAVKLFLNDINILTIIDKPSSLDKLTFQHKIDQGIPLNDDELCAFMVSKGIMDADNKDMYSQLLITNIIQKLCSTTDANGLLLKNLVTDFLKVKLPNNQFIAGKSCSVNEKITNSEGTVFSLLFKIEYFGGPQKVHKPLANNQQPPKVKKAKRSVNNTTQKNRHNAINYSTNKRFSILLKIENKQVFHIELCGSVSDYYNPATGRHFFTEAKAIFNCFTNSSKTSNNVYNLLSLVFNYCQSWGDDLPHVLNKKGRFKRDRTVGKNREKLFLEIIDLS
jgi:hypothetical protein